MAEFRSPEIAPGEYADIFEFLMKDLKLFKRRLVFSLKHVESGEPMQYAQTWYRQAQKHQLIELVKAGDLAAIAAFEKVPEGDTGGQTGLYLEFRWVKSGRCVGVQVCEARPHEGGRYVSLSPAVVYTEEDGARVLPVIEKLRP